MRLLSFALFASLVACGQASTSTSSSTPVTNSPVASTPVVSPATATLASKVIGQYAVRVRLTLNQTLPLLGKSSGTSSLYKLATIAESPEGFTVTESGCEFNYEGGTAPLKITLSKDAVRSGPVTTSPIQIWEDQGVVYFDRDFTTMVLGAELNDADLDALPTSTSDSRVIDADQDGQAGVTAHASGKVKIFLFSQNVDADVYFVQRSRTKYTGTMVENGHLSGTVIDNTEQSLLGSSNVLLTLGGNIPSTQDPDVSKSSVDFIRVSDEATCDTVEFKTAF